MFEWGMYINTVIKIFEVFFEVLQKYKVENGGHCLIKMENKYGKFWRWLNFETIFLLFSHTQLVIILSCAISKQGSHSSKFSFFMLCSVGKLVCFSIIPTCTFQILHPHFCWPVSSSIVFIADHMICPPEYSIAISLSFPNLPSGSISLGPSWQCF